MRRCFSYEESTETEWECFLDQLDAEELEQEYIILWDYDDQLIGFYKRVGFRYSYEAVIDGCDCVVVCQTNEKEWLDEEYVDRYRDGAKWVYVQEDEDEEEDE